MEDKLNFVCTWKMTSIFWKMEDELTFRKMEDDLNLFSIMEEDLYFFVKGRQPHFLENQCQDIGIV
jgi:hypothetical protein